MSDELAATDEIVLPISGELVNLADPARVAIALADVREWKRQLDEIRRLLEETLVTEAQKQGTKTLHLDGAEATVSGGVALTWDVEELLKLRDLGLPEERLNELLRPVVEYKVDGAVARQIAGSGNADYAACIQAAKVYRDTAWRVAVQRRQLPAGTSNDDQ